MAIDDTLPQYRCGECGTALSGHLGYVIGHAWRPAKEWVEWWSAKESGLIPMPGAEGEGQSTPSEGSVP